jgi:3-hydroxybutyryl-CoA dehydrogenase
MFVFRIVAAALQTLYEFGGSKYRPAPMLREMVAAGYLGRKSGRSVCRY